MEEMMSLRGRVIVVTGAAQGIGRAIAASTIDLSAMVVDVDLNAEKLEAPATAKNAHLPPYVGSVADPKFSEATVRDVNWRFGSIHGLVNNAGITRPAMLEKMTLQQWTEVDALHIWREDALRAFAWA